MASAIAAQEPSMEEILASIRQIISEDGGGNADTPAPMSPAAEASAPAANGAGMMPRNAPAPSPVVNVAEPRAENIAPPHPIAASMSATNSPNAKKEPDPMPLAAASPMPHAAPLAQTNDVRLLSPDSDAAVSGAFSALAHTILAQNARTLEDLVCEMLRPMLKEWLDDNLPPLVERMVSEEIHRVSRPRR